VWIDGWIETTTADKNAAPNGDGPALAAAGRVRLQPRFWTISSPLSVLRALKAKGANGHIPPTVGS